jgi:phospholipase A1/A2
MKIPATFPVRRKSPLVLSILTLGAGVLGPAWAGDCTTIADDSQRLACYDKQYRTVAKPVVPVAPTEVIGSEASPEAQLKVADTVQPETGLRRPKRSLVEAWDLDQNNPREAFAIRTYKPMYLLLANYTDNINREPKSENPNNTDTVPLGLDATEAKFQLSFKTKVADKLIGNNGSLWMGYTQSSRWQLFNSSDSRPFRETNYEPEAMLVFRTPFQALGWQAQMTSISLNHQSNGRALPLSRSWNRVILQLGLEREDWTLLIRPWWRIHESTEDDNPGIQNYLGRGEIILARHLGEHVLSVQARHSLRLGEESRGSLRFDWAIPIAGNLKGHLSVFSGYGESLIDYNHRQTMVGAGISLVDW